MHAAPKSRDDLEYFDQEIDGEEIVLVRDPIRGTFYRFNPLKGAMLRALDGKRTAAEITAKLSEQYDVEIPPAAAERFIARARELMLLEITAYDATSKTALRRVRRALRKAGFRTRSRERESLRVQSEDGAQLAEAFAEIEREHPRAAAAYLAEILRRDPHNARAKQLYDLIQGAYIRAAGGTFEFPTWAMFDPSRLLAWLSRTAGHVIFSWIGVLAIFAFVCLGAYAYTNVEFGRVALGPGEIAIAIVMKTIAGLLHELGHGLACQHYGGKVTEIGFTLLYYVQPAFYCDTSSSYKIAVRRHRMLVQLGGTVVSLVFNSALAIVLMVMAPSVPIYPGLTLVLLIASALVFANLNPFLKFDGYYAICDYFGFANLRDRSYKLARAWLSKRLLGIAIPTEELPRRTRIALVAYAIVSVVFTAWFIYIAASRVLVPIVERYRGAGLVLAVVASALLLRKLTLRPLWDLARMIVRERRQIFRPRRTVVLAVVAAALVGPWFVRWPVLVDATFVVVPHQRADVRVQAAGRVDEIFVAEGDRVKRGQVIATLRNPALQARVATLEAEQAVASRRLELVRGGARPEELALARRRLDHARSEVERASRDAAVASTLAAAALGTQAGADATGARAAVSAGAAGAARWSLSLLAAGARPEDIEVAEAEHARIASQLAHARAEVALLTLRSPIDGVVATPHLEDTRQVMLAPGDRLAEIHDLSAMVGEVALRPSEPLAELGVGREVALRLHGAPGDEILVRIERVRETAEGSGADERIVVVTSPFAPIRPISGLTGHARIYGEERSLAYANLYLPLQRLIRVRLWSMW